MGDMMYSALQLNLDLAVSPQAYALYLIWKELFTFAVTSCMNMAVLFSLPETFLIPILCFYNELSHQLHVFHV